MDVATSTTISWRFAETLGCLQFHFRKLLSLFKQVQSASTEYQLPYNLTMPPCESEKQSAETPVDDAIALPYIVKPPGQPLYVRCDSSEPFVNPTVSECTRQKTAAEINQSLNLNLGQKVLRPENKIANQNHSLSQ